MLYFIVNSHARSGRALDIWNELECILNERRIEYSRYFTEYVGHATVLSRDITAKASADNPVTLVIFGGDGTVNEVYNGITNHRYITLGYIPTGSGNDFARGLKLEKDPVRALDNILSAGKLRRIECGILSDDKHTRKFAVSCGMGYDATVTYRVLNSKVKKAFNKIGLGKLVYTFFGVMQVICNPKTSADIYIDDKPALQAKRLYFASIHVLKYEGGGFPFAPHANPSDGLLSVCVFHDTTRLGFAINLISSIFSKHIGRRGVSAFQCKTCSVKASKANHTHTDGEDFGSIPDMTASVCSDDEFINIIV